MTDDASDLLRGAAFHEAGHAIVAAHFRLPLGKITIDVDGGGNAEIDDTADLPIIDRIALRVAGLEAQHIFECRTHDLAGFDDQAKVLELLEELAIPESDREEVRMSGYQRAHDILQMHKADVKHLPLAAWVAFAGVLNLAIWRLNA